MNFLWTRFCSFLEYNDLTIPSFLFPCEMEETFDKRSFRSCAITAATDRSEDEQTNCLKEKTKIYIEQKSAKKIFSCLKTKFRPIFYL